MQQKNLALQEMAEPASWKDAQAGAKTKREQNKDAWFPWDAEPGAKPAKLLAAAQKLLDAAAAAAEEAGEAARLATAAAKEGAGGAAVDATAAATAATAATEAEAKKIKAWKYAAQAIALANEVKGKKSGTVLV
jgi:hypothetical protein